VAAVQETVLIGTGGNGFIHLKVFQHICDKSEAQSCKDDNIANHLLPDRSNSCYSGSSSENCTHWHRRQRFYTFKGIPRLLQQVRGTKLQGRQHCKNSCYPLPSIVFWFHLRNFVCGYRVKKNLRF
jgi:hypothetical protein